MIERRRLQRSFGDGLIADEVKDLREKWMNHADRLLDDEAIVSLVYQALGRRHPKSRSRGRLSTGRGELLRGDDLRRPDHDDRAGGLSDWVGLRARHQCRPRPLRHREGVRRKVSVLDSLTTLLGRKTV